MVISKLSITSCKLAPTVTVLCTRNFACTNVRAKPFYVHENQCMPNIKSVEPWNSPSLPWSRTTYWKKASLLAFIKLLPKNLPATYIFRSIIMTYLKKFLGIKSLNSIQNSVHHGKKTIYPLYIHSFFFPLLLNHHIKKSHTCEEGRVHFRISLWHLLTNLKNK